MTWFESLTGLENEHRDTVYTDLRLDGTAIVSRANGRRLEAGRFSMPSLAELRQQPLPKLGKTTVREFVSDVEYLYASPGNAGAVFQVASQFNMLEMIGPSVTPEDGIGGYEHDHTQGPASAIACGGGTILRNYFVPTDGQIGQTAETQLDGLADLGDAFGNPHAAFWQMRNGYALPTSGGLARLNAVLDKGDRDALMGLLRIGLQADVEVTLEDAGHLVTQVFCSAMPVAYAHDGEDDWAPIATLVLDAAYEATLRVAAQNLANTGNPVVYLTLLGGGAFGNRSVWIMDALTRGLALVADCGLDVRIVSYGQSNPLVEAICTDQS